MMYDPEKAEAGYDCLCRSWTGAGQPLGGHKRLAVGGACHCHAGPVDGFVELHLSSVTRNLRKC
eukprot:scaffold52826_cov16-Prasinocladus_malaysianus.AAC.1